MPGSDEVQLIASIKELMKEQTRLNEILHKVVAIHGNKDEMAPVFKTITSQYQTILSSAQKAEHIAGALKNTDLLGIVKEIETNIESDISILNKLLKK